MANIIDKIPPYFDSKLNLAYELFKQNHPDISVSFRQNPSGDYTDILFEGIGNLRLTNTSIATMEVDQIINSMDKFVRYPKVETEKKDESWTDKWIREHQ